MDHVHADLGGYIFTPKARTLAYEGIPVEVLDRYILDALDEEIRDYCPEGPDRNYLVILSAQWVQDVYPLVDYKKIKRVIDIRIGEMLEGGG